MTCIAGLKQGKDIYLASDSQSTWGMTKHESGSKIIKKGALMAFTGLCAVPHTIEHRLSIPEVPENDETKWVHVKLIDEIRRVLKDMNLLDKDDGSMNAEAIIGWRNHLVTVDSSFNVSPVLRDYVAMGSGGQVAIGALYASINEKSPKKRLKTAVEAAQVWSVGVGGDVYIEKV